MNWMEIDRDGTVSCVETTQGASVADTGKLFVDTGGWEGKFKVMGGSLWGVFKSYFDIFLTSDF